MNFNMFIPTKVIFGQGQLNELSNQSIPGHKAMIVISNGKSSRANGYLDSVINQLTMAGKRYCVFDQIEANPTLDNINDGAKYCRDNQCDLIVALGGGSVIDSSKAIALLTTNGEDMWDFIQVSTGGKKNPTHDPLPIISVVTTAGTGSEIDCAGAFTKMDTNEKVSFKDERLFPLITIIDPLLQLSVPSHFTAFQGWDALTHSLENRMNKHDHEMAKILAREAIRIGGENLTKATLNGNDLEAREQMALCSYLSGMVIHSSGTTSMHALECALSAFYPSLPHGAGLAMISIPYFHFFINHHACDDIFIEMSKLLGNKEANKAEDFIETVLKIQRECSIDQLKMSDYGIDPSCFDEVVKLARETMPGNFTNDRISLTNQDCLDILNQSYK